MKGSDANGQRRPENAPRRCPPCHLLAIHLADNGVTLDSRRMRPISGITIEMRRREGTQGSGDSGEGGAD